MTKEEIENYFVECAGYGRDKMRNFMDIVNKALEQKNERITELEQKLEQAEKDLADYQFNYPTIKELQKEIEELKKTYRKQRNKRIDELQKENAELKSEKGCETCTKFDEVQLTKAKELLRDVLPYIDLTDCVNSDPRLVLYDKIESLIEEEE